MFASWSAIGMFNLPIAREALCRTCVTMSSESDEKRESTGRGRIGTFEI
jgi:hypothetical protein